MTHTDIEITSVRIRKIRSNNIVAIASITLNRELIINDIVINNTFSGGYQIKLPNTSFAKAKSQYSIVPSRRLYRKIKDKIIGELGRVLCEDENIT